jgi:hypothetical protein
MKMMQPHSHSKWGTMMDDDEMGIYKHTSITDLQLN